jgi:ATP-dependent RNA helicase DDX23/PRP28
MPQEVERIAKCYLRHPVSIKIGDEGSGKNKRIEQLVYFVAEPQKKSRLMEQLRRLTPTDKVIIFVNLKRQGDTVGSYVSQCGLTFGVIHGGKSQDQREEALEMFRNDDIQVHLPSSLPSSFSCPIPILLIVPSTLSCFLSLPVPSHFFPSLPRSWWQLMWQDVVLTSLT